MRPNALAGQNGSVKATNKLFDEALDREALVCLAAADDLGRISEGPHRCNRDYFTERLQIYEDLMKQPQVTGQDLIQAGIKPCPDFSRYLRYAHKLHLSGVKKETALRQTLAEIEKRKNWD